MNGSDIHDPFAPPQVTTGEEPQVLDPALAQGKPKKSLAVFGMVIALTAVGAWVLWPEHKPVGQKIKVENSAASQQQASQQSKNFMAQLEQQAGGGIPVPSASTAVGSGTPKPAIAGPVPAFPYGNASGPSLTQMTPEEKAKQRREQIWAASPSVPGLHLMAGGSGTDAGNGGLQNANGVEGSIQSQIEQARARLASMSPQAAAQEALRKLQAQQSSGEASMLAAAQQASAEKQSPNDQFLKAHQQDDGASPILEHAAYTSPVLMQGTVIRAVTVSGIDTDLPGSITARVTSNVYGSVNAQHLLIPMGSILIGRYSSDFKVGQSRVLVAMTRLILPDGKWISLAGTPATDGEGMSGMPADVNNHFFKMFGASFIIGAASLLLPNSQQSVTVNMGTTGSQTGGTVFAQSLQQTVQTLLQRNLNIPPTGTVDPGTPFLFMVSRDMLMQPYRSQ